MVRKVTRIFLKSVGITLLIIVLLAIGLYFGAQTYTFQTWLGKRASKYLSDELKSKVYVEKVNLDFFSMANLEGVYILDKHKDTLLNGDILVKIKLFDFDNQKLLLDDVTLKNVTSKVIQYKNDSALNYQFLLDYFKGDNKDTSKSKDWIVTLGPINLENVNFVYSNQNYKPISTKGIIDFNNISVKHTYGKISGFKLDGDTILATISNLRTKEQSGFVLSDFSSKVKISEKKLLCENLNLKTPNTIIKGKIDFAYDNWGDYSDFLNKIKLNSKLEDSTCVYMPDIAYFAPELKGLNENVNLSGTVKGYISDLHLTKFKLRLGKNTRFNGDLTITGLPEIKTCYLHFNAKEISSSYSDITSIPNYPFHEGKNIELPVEIKKLGKISYKGKFDGFINDFTTHGKFKTDLGAITTQMSIKLSEKLKDIAYSGKLHTENFSLGTLIGQKDLNNLSMNCEVKGKGITIKDINSDFKGEIQSLNFNNYNYHNIQLNGNFSNKLFSGVLTSKDPNANLDFNGTVNFKNEVPEMDFISTLNNLNLNKLHFTNARDSGNLSSQVLINIKGKGLDDLSGQINFDNTIYKTKTRQFKLSTFDVQLEQAGIDKKIKLNSAYINASIEGNYNLSTLSTAFQTLLYKYYPDFFQKPRSNKIFTDRFDYKLTVKKFKTINELFLPEIMLSPGSNIEGTFNFMENKLTGNFTSSKFDYKNFHFNNASLTINEKDSLVIAGTKCKSVLVGDSLSFNNVNFAINSQNNKAAYTLNWNNELKPEFKGALEGRINYLNSSLNLFNDKVNITVNDSTWNMLNPNRITIDNQFNITLNPLVFTNNLQSINISGTYTNKSNDSLIINTSKLALNQFNPLLKLFGVKTEGIVNSYITLSKENGNFIFNGNLNLSGLKINDNTIGELIANAQYNLSAKRIDMNGFTSLGMQDELGNQMKNISFNGSYYLERKEESLDIDFKAQPLNLRLINPLLEGILTIKSGFANGEGKIHGTPSDIKIDGKMKLFNSEVKVDYTNVSYNISGDIEIMPDQIRFSELMMREKGLKSSAQGTINGNIFHNNFKRIQLDYDVSYKNMLVLNTSAKENSLFYGKVYGTGNMGIYGFLNDIHMKVTDTTTKNSKFYLPLDGPAEIEDNDFIHFVKKDTIPGKEPTPITGFNLDLALFATPDAQAQIILDKQNGDLLKVQGQGDLNLKINTLGKFEMVGDYVITNGDYIFTLESVINKKFEIESGSSISWSGDPLNADINVIASYKQRASVAPLLNDTSSQYRGRSPVDCKLLISDKLLSPEIKFDVVFPTLDATAKSLIGNVLSDEVELNRQVFSFLLFRSFLTPQIFNSGGGVTAFGAAASTGSEILSNRLSDFLNSYFGDLTGLNDLQLGLNYRAGGQNNNDAVDLALSKQFLNNKITIDGNIGVQNRNGNGNGLIGDVNIDYRLSDDGRYRLKGFNKSNDNAQIAMTGGPYTQGIGFFYREEFETFNELFFRYLKKVKKATSKNK